MKHTPWFPANVKPVRAGVYQSKEPLLPWYRYWDGEYWHAGGPTPILAKSYAGVRFEETPPEPWRGIAEEPK